MSVTVLKSKEVNLEKVVVSCGFGKMSKEQETECSEILTAITGQVPVVTVARRSISNFSVRRGMRSGLKVTLRRDKALWFVTKVMHVVLTSRSDFKGFNARLNGRSFNFSLTNLHLFPEVEETTIRGLNVSLIFYNDLEMERYLSRLSVPLK